MRIWTVLPLLFLAACAGQVKVPPVPMDPTFVGSPIAGSYAVVVQSGGWDLKTKAPGGACSAWTFDTNVNQSYADAMTAAIKASLEKVTLVHDAMSPPQMKDKGYDAQVFIYQGNAKSDFGVQTGFFMAHAVSTVELTTLVAVVDNKGARWQQTVIGKGAGGQDAALTCDRVGAAIAGAAQTAIADSVKTTILYLRNDLLERALKAAAGK